MMDKPQIIGLGLSGLVGTRIAQLLSDQYDIIPLGRSAGVDITDKKTLEILNNYKDARIVLHLAGKTDVDGCEQDKNLGEEGDAWKINVAGTQNIHDACSALGKKIIYFSTDFVFDGKKPEGDSYLEEDKPNPQIWYAKTKYEGEKIVNDGTNLIIRIAYPYRARFEQKPDFMRFIKEKLEKGEEIKVVIDQIFCPTFIDDIAKALEVLIKNDASGIYHAVGSEALTPFEAATKISTVFGLDKNLIGQTTRTEFFKDRAPRPFNSALRNDKIERLGVRMRGFSEGLLSVKSQLNQPL